MKRIEKNDWVKIDQIIIEVHNTNNKLSTIKSLLSEKEYMVKVQQETKLEGTGLYVLHATRRHIYTHYKTKKVVI